MTRGGAGTARSIRERFALTLTPTPAAPDRDGEEDVARPLASLRGRVHGARYEPLSRPRYRCTTVVHGPRGERLERPEYRRRGGEETAKPTLE